MKCSHGSSIKEEFNQDGGTAGWDGGQEGKRTEVRGRVKQLTANHDTSSAFIDGLTGNPPRAA